MRLGSLRAGGRDGTLVVISADHTRGLRTPIATVRGALENWDAAEPVLSALALEVEGGAGEPLDIADLHAPLPRAFQYCEGSTYLSHMERCRGARGVPLPPGHGRDAAVLQAAGDRFLAPTEPIVLGDTDWGLDFEATVAVVVDDVPQGVTVGEAPSHVELIVLLDDLTLRALLQVEFTKGIGFFQAKPWRPFAPIALTPDELGPLWDGRLLRSKLLASVNGKLIGELDTASDVSFDFAQVLVHAAMTRGLSAGTIVGSGTVSTRDPARGCGCLAELRALEITRSGEPSTPWLAPGDEIHIEAFDDAGRSLFGAMRNRVVALEGAGK